MPSSACITTQRMVYMLNILIAQYELVPIPMQVPGEIGLFASLQRESVCLVDTACCPNYHSGISGPVSSP
jgi:hypothetical protein